jgi:hypothetical protein
MSCVILRGRWCDIIVLNVHALTEDKWDYTNDSFCEELEGVFNQFPKYHMKILLGDFKISVQRWGGKIFLNRQLGMRVCMKLVMIMGLE